MVDSTLEMTKKGLALSQRERERKTEAAKETLHNVSKLIVDGKLNKGFLPFVLYPTNRKEHTKLTPGFKNANQHLHELDQIFGLDKSKLKALEKQASEYEYYANMKGITDNSSPIDVEGKRYYYPHRELEQEKNLIAGIEAKGEERIRSLNRLAESEPQILDNASKRLRSIRQIVKVPQSYEDIDLPPIEKPVTEFLDDLVHAEQDTRMRARKVLKEAGIDGDAIIKESQTHDPRTGRALFMSETDRMVEEAKSSPESQILASKGLGEG